MPGPPSTGPPPKKRDVLRLVEGDLVLEWPGRISELEYRDVRDWLTLMQRKISRCVTPRGRLGL